MFNNVNPNIVTDTKKTINKSGNVTKNTLTAESTERSAENTKRKPQDNKTNKDLSGLKSIANEIYQSLGADQADIQALTNLLEKEKIALESQDSQAITAFAEEKNVIVLRMEKRSILRNEVLKRHQLEHDETNWIKTIEKLDDATDLPLLNLWKNMQTQLRDCQQLLMINERILGGLQQGVERFMTLLKNSAGTTQTYNASGKTEDFLSRKPISKA